MRCAHVLLTSVCSLNISGLAKLWSQQLLATLLVNFFTFIIRSLIDTVILCVSGSQNSLNLVDSPCCQFEIIRRTLRNINFCISLPTSLPQSSLELVRYAVGDETNDWHNFNAMLTTYNMIIGKASTFYVSSAAFLNSFISRHIVWPEAMWCVLTCPHSTWETNHQCKLSTVNY